MFNIIPFVCIIRTTLHRSSRRSLARREIPSCILYSNVFKVNTKNKAKERRSRSTRTRCSSSRRFPSDSKRGCRAWQGSRTRGWLTKPYRLTSASDLTRNSLLSVPWLVSPCTSISEFLLSRYVG